MDYQVQRVLKDAQITAVIRCKARQSELSKVVPACCGEVWNYLRASGAPRPGRHVALYLDGEINLEVGAEVDRPFTGNDRVCCSQTPAGMVASTEHVGPYDRLAGAHQAILQWCVAEGLNLSGPSWEVYGHWDDDPAQLRTEVFYLLDDPSRS